MIGQTLSQFRITAKLGEGGMGAVYRADDTKLGREVAIKVLPEAFSSDPERVARFEREARALAALNHPNIAAIYGFEEAAPQVKDDVGTESAAARFLVMELVEGEDLADRLKHGAIPLDEALRISHEITHALEAAHRKGIVHRDLKPANIKLDESGAVKVLDFGLAKALEPEAGPGDDGDLAESPTLTYQATVAGVLLGTAGYMSPEQARGEPVDARADIWAFGVVLWEMLTGHRLFTGKTASDTLAGVLRQEIDLEQLPPSTPQALRRLLGRCLEREADSRLRDVADARLEIEDAIANPDPEVLAKPGGISRLWPVTAFAGVVVGIGLGALLWRGEVTPSSSRPLTILRTMARPVHIGRINARPELALSPDGRHLVYSSRDGSLVHRQLDRLVESLIPGTEGARYPEFSPDGTTLAFYRDRRLWRIPLAGGQAVQLQEQNSDYVGGLDWATDGHIYTTIYRSLVRVPEGGGPSEFLELPEDPAEPGRWIVGDAETLRDDWKIEESAVLYPSVLPDGETLLYTAFTEETGELEFGAGEVWTLSLADGARRKVAVGYGQLVPTASGHLLACSPDGTVSAIPFDPQTNELTGPPTPVLQGVMPYSNYYPGCHMAFSTSGTAAYLPLKFEARDHRLAWLDRQGRLEPLAEFVGQFWSPRLSPDGKRLAYQELRFDDNLPAENIWTIDLERQVRTRLTDLRRALFPVWSRDGETLFFSQPQPTGGWKNGGVFSVPAVGGVEPARESRGIFQGVMDMSPDSRFLLIDTDLGGGEDLAFFPRGRPEEIKYLLESRVNRTAARFSPDGRWVAFMQGQRDGWEVFVTAFPESSGTIQISRDGGVAPKWSPDGQAIFYLSGKTVYRVPVDTSGRFEAGAPEVFTEVTGLPENTVFSLWDLAEDGRFVGLIRDTRVTDRQQIDIALNFFDELERLAPHT